jgi:hypothetical protein
VTVNDQDNGDGKLHNAVTTPTEPNGVDPSNCAGSSAPECSTQTGVAGESAGLPPSGPPAFTGNDTRLQLIVAGWLLAAGALFLLLGVRRRGTA